MLISSSVDRHLGFSAFGDRGWRCCGRPRVFKFPCEHQCQFSPCMSGWGFTAAVTVTKCDGIGSRGGWEGKPRCPGEVAACPSGDTGSPSGGWGWGRRGQSIRPGSDSGGRGPVLAGCSGQEEGGQTCPWKVQRGLKHLLPQPSQIICVPKAVVAQVAGSPGGLVRLLFISCVIRGPPSPGICFLTCQIDGLMK